MAAFEKHVFVCTNTRAEGHPRGCCSAKDAGAIRERLKELVEKRGLKRKIRVNTAGCLDQCEHGVTMVVYPEAVWYGFVKPGDVEEILESHLVGARRSIDCACPMAASTPNAARTSPAARFSWGSNRIEGEEGRGQGVTDSTCAPMYFAMRR